MAAMDFANLCLPIAGLGLGFGSDNTTFQDFPFYEPLGQGQWNDSYQVKNEAGYEFTGEYLMHSVFGRRHAKRSLVS